MGRAVKDVAEAPDRGDLDPPASGERAMPRLGARGGDWMDRLIAALAKAVPSMTASAPHAIAFTRSPEVETDPSAMTWT